MRILLIDDYRELNADYTARTYEDGIKALQKEKWDVLYLDHDLGEVKTGYDILCWLELNPQYLPKKIIIISSNPSGRERMKLIIDKLYKEN